MPGKRIQYSGPQSPGKNTPKTFIEKVAPLAIRACANTGILPSVVIGIGLKESLFGNDYKAALFNNPFGHRAFDSWSGDGVRMSKNGVYWRAYPSLYDGIKAHVSILQQGKFKVEGVALKSTPKAQLDSLQRAGYNVGADKAIYAGKINNIINQYDLHRYDKQLIAYEKTLNNNGLAFHEQDGITKALHNIFA